MNLVGPSFSNTHVVSDRINLLNLLALIIIGNNNNHAYIIVSVLIRYIKYCHAVCEEPWTCMRGGGGGAAVT